MKTLVSSSFIGLLGVFLVAPTFIIFIISATSGSSLSFPTPGYSLRWYETFFATPKWRNAAVTSVEVAIWATLGATILGTMTAFGLARGRFWGRRILAGLLLSPIVVPVIVTGLGMYMFYLRLNLVGTKTALIVSHISLGLPFVVINVLAGLRNFDRNIELAAQSCGASWAQVLLRITIPALAPSIVAGALFAFITSWDEAVVSFFLSTPRLQTLPVVIWSEVSRDLNPTVAAASALVTALTFIVFVVVMSRGHFKLRTA